MKETLMKSPLVPVVWATMLCTAGNLPAQDPAETVRSMSLQQCIESALEHNLDVQIERLGPVIARHNLGLAYSDWDPVFSASGEHSYSLQPGGIDAQSRAFQGSETESDSFSSAIRGVLPTGTTYSLGLQLNDSYGTRPDFQADFSRPRVETVTLTNVFDPGQVFGYTVTNYDAMMVRSPFESTYGSMGFFELRQPLLKNFWIDSTRMSISVNKKSLKISEWMLQYQIMLIVNQIEQAYYDLIFGYENVKVQQTALQLAERLLSDNRKKVEVGALAPLEEKSAESQVAVTRADLLSAQRSLAAQQNALKNLITDQYAEWHPLEIQPTEKLMPVPVTLDLQASWAKGFANRPDLQQARLNLERQNITVRYGRNQLFPQLDLFGRFGYSASGKEFSDALGQLRDGDNDSYAVGASVSIPLSNRRARENYKASKAQKEQLQLQLKQAEQNVMVQIDDAVKLVQMQYERVKATRQAREFAQEALEAEQKKLENGKSTPYQVLLMQRDLTMRSSEEIRVLAEYNKALAQLALAEGTILERHQLTVEVR